MNQDELFGLALEICKTINASCRTKQEIEALIKLVSLMVELR